MRREKEGEEGKRRGGQVEKWTGGERIEEWRGRDGERKTGGGVERIER